MSEECKILFKTGYKNVVHKVMSGRNGWIQTKSTTDWDILWADIHWIKENLKDFARDETQRINHFENHYEISRKDLLNKNFERFKKACKREGNKDVLMKLNFVPKTFVLPNDFQLFVECRLSFHSTLCFRLQATSR